jgi:hypothetical protein
MLTHGLNPHISGMTLDGQRRYADDVTYSRSL